jgi:acyl-CoA thioesterase YciA
MPESREPAIRVPMMPKDTNSQGTIFGGILLSYLDHAGAIATRAHCERVVTVKMTEVVFHQPVLVGDVVTFYAAVTRIGNTSITVHVDVEAERWRAPGQGVKVTEADIVYVNLDENRKPTPIRKG